MLDIIEESILPHIASNGSIETLVEVAEYLTGHTKQLIAEKDFNAARAYKSLIDLLMEIIDYYMEHSNYGIWPEALQTLLNSNRASLG